ncbi:Alpha-(1,3)-fucosyltransferase 11 [Haplosporangium gracile]|nr:Alpha-(1,3)-fucosyltransferase 11 [Haplosporangium gracile]
MKTTIYLTIENNNCDDYVTEKIQRPYSVGVVPILNRPKDYFRCLATNYSSIRLDDLATSKQLAHRIHRLDQEDAAYMKYLDNKEFTAPIESKFSIFSRELGDLGSLWNMQDGTRHDRRHLSVQLQ